MTGSNSRPRADRLPELLHSALRRRAAVNLAASTGAITDWQVSDLTETAGHEKIENDFD